MATAAKHSACYGEVGGGSLYLLSLEGLSEAELLARAALGAEDAARYAAFPPEAEQRRLEWLGARVLVREVLGGEVGYAPDGRPRLVGGTVPCHISISHTRGWVALLTADTPCGIDIELSDRSAERVARRIATSDELTLAAELFPENPALLVWCAKEAAYKAIGRPGLDFLHEIQLQKKSARGLLITIQPNVIRLQFTLAKNLICVGGSVKRSK